MLCVCQINLNTCIKLLIFKLNENKMINGNSLNN